MKLTLEPGGEIDSPSAAVVSHSLRSLPANAGAFAILARGEQRYIQTAGSPGEGFVLEYREGSERQHYRCHLDRLTLDQVERAFLSYLDGRDDYKTELPWEPGFGSSGPRFLWLAGFLLAGVSLGIYWCWRLS
ncbi:MAG: hypothetical protein MJE66_05225 [Proteobacteria bacterium]|nr:hypothetical protein [Pseudomonadota bacterium]